MPVTIKIIGLWIAIFLYSISASASSSICEQAIHKLPSLETNVVRDILNKQVNRHKLVQLINKKYPLKPEGRPELLDFLEEVLGLSSKNSMRIEKKMRSGDLPKEVLKASLYWLLEGGQLNLSDLESIGTNESIDTELFGQVNGIYFSDNDRLRSVTFYVKPSQKSIVGIVTRNKDETTIKQFEDGVWKEVFSQVDFFIHSHWHKDNDLIQFLKGKAELPKVYHIARSFNEFQNTHYILVKNQSNIEVARIVVNELPSNTTEDLYINFLMQYSGNNIRMGEVLGQHALKFRKQLVSTSK